MTLEDKLAGEYGPLPSDARFDAYYYSFEPTGVGPVDAILSSVAVAGKGFHHTESWWDTSDFGYYKGHPGLLDADSAVDLIQKNAEHSADLIKTLLSRVKAAEAAITEARGYYGATETAYVVKVLDDYLSKEWNEL